jgi:hypothetical protein
MDFTPSTLTPTPTPTPAKNKRIGIERHMRRRLRVLDFDEPTGEREVEAFPFLLLLRFGMKQLRFGCVVQSPVVADDRSRRCGLLAQFAPAATRVGPVNGKEGLRA